MTDEIQSSLEHAAQLLDLASSAFDAMSTHTEGLIDETISALLRAKRALTTPPHLDS